MQKTTIVAFYKFVRMSDLGSLKTALKEVLVQHEIYGTLLLASEGFNATLAGHEENIQSILNYIRVRFNCEDLECKFSYADFIPFRKLKVLIKKEIITLNVPGLDPERRTGIRVSPEAWNTLVLDKEVMVIDTRNKYEVECGSFKNAIHPNTDEFSRFPEFVKQNLDVKRDKKIAMFCTGGIRCEKASAFLMQQGFEEVYQLQGGILNYLEKIKPEESVWEGKCFVFDERRVAN